MQVPSYDLIDELARSGAYTVYRARRLADGRPFLLKIATRVPARAADREGLQREFDNLRRWSLPGVPKPQAIEDHNGVAVLVLENDDVTSLRELMRRGRLDLDACVRVALGACAVLGDIHRHGGTHGAVTPDTVLVSATGDAQLLDLGLSVNRLADLRPAATASGATYISPEQTARINRTIDYRTDFYSLGATLYELLTGAPPFQSSDALELIHAHIARAPVPPSQRNPAVPETLSRIVLKLLAKAADDRYQSARGLKHDLERCQREWRESGTVTPFALGARDVPDRFLVSQKLYGREKEVANLLTAFDRTCEGDSALVLVAGYSGIGKTSLIQELYRPIVQQRGYFIAGKCDQVVRNIPFSAFAQAMRSLVSQLLTESESRLAEWRTRLSSALGSNGGVLAEVVPEIELILGRQPAAPPLEPTESRNRFGMVFQAFVATLARQEHPLVIFLDDLQWVDAATLDLLQALVTAPDLGHLLIVGAYRDNEVDATHLLSWAVERLIESGATVERMAVDSLTIRDLTSLVGDTLHTTDAQAGPLAGLLQRKTDGNPFFVIQFMQTLNQDGLFTFDHDRGEWRFDIDQIESAEMTDNVVDLMTRKIRRLSRAAERVLTMAACIGNRFDEGMLLTVSRQSPEEAAVGLAEALDTGLIRAVESPATANADADGRAGSFSFLHDRVQQAAYGLIPDAQKKTVHLDMGRLLLAGTDRTDLDERIFTIVNHLNIGADLITDRDERRVAAQLNLSAGRKAKTSTAYRAALDYFEHGMSLLDPPDWSREYKDVLYPLHLESAECQHLCGEFASADVSFQTLLQHVVNPLDQAQVHGLRTTLYNQSRWADAIVSGLQGLGLFGISFPQDAAAREAALEQEMATIERELAGRPIAALVALPVMTDVSIKMVMRLLMNIWAPAFIFNDHATARLISATMVRLSLTYGNTEESAYGYVTHAITVGPVRREYATAYEWGVLAVNVNKAFNDLTRRAKIEQQFQAHVNPWCRPFATCIAHAREACRSGLETGDFIYVGYAVASEAWAALAANRDLDRFVREYTPALAMLEKVKMADFRAAHEIVLSWTLALQGRTTSRTSITHDGFDEQAFIARYERTSPFFLTFLYAAKLHLCLMHEQFVDAVAAFRRARAVAATGTIWPVLIDAWGALATAAAWDTLSASERDSARRELLATQQELRELSDSCPENFKSFWLLVAAEVTRVNGDQATAARLAEDAVAHARDTDNLQLEALALEVGARIWRRAGRDDDATRCLRDAHRAYARWGAAAKTAQLEERYPEVRAALQVTATEADAPRTRASELPTAEPAATPSLDMATVFKIAHAVAVEIELDGLLRTLMRLALENAGADRALFLQEQPGGGLAIAAEAVADPPQVRVGPLVAIDDAPGVARSVARYVQRTRHDLVLAHAAHDDRFGGDDYVRASGAKSLLCVPVGHQGRLGGILYLENSFATDVFTPDRIEMMRILAAQTAISLENARLYADMKDEVARRTTAEGALREALSEVEALKSRLEAENVYLQEEIRTQHNFNEIVGNSPSLVAALRKVERVAPTESTVLIVGETGSGKEMFARAVHSRSQRSARPLVKVNCGAIAPGLVESELFGHVKGAFTGAIERRIGRFELANGGTIFLDEVGELPLDAQVKLLRVLQEQEFEPVGSSRTVRVSVRVIAATNRDLASAVREGRFRADLLYRLNVFPIEVPPLRDRPTDIPLLIGFFSTGLSRKLGKPIQGFSAHSLERMSGYTWPGNVRELQNVVERAAILAQGPVLQLEDTVLGETRPAATAAGPIAFVASGDSMDDVQRGHILSVLQSTGGVVEGARGAASILGMHPNTLRSRMKKLGIPTAPRPQSGS